MSHHFCILHFFWIWRLTWIRLCTSRGRGDELQRTIRILGRRTKNNPVLIGEAGNGNGYLPKYLFNDKIWDDNCSFFNSFFFQSFVFPWFWKFQSLKFTDVRNVFCSQAGVGKTSIASALGFTKKNLQKAQQIWMSFRCSLRFFKHPNSDVTFLFLQPLFVGFVSPTGFVYRSCWGLGSCTTHCWGQGTTELTGEEKFLDGKFWEKWWQIGEFFNTGKRFVVVFFLLSGGVHARKLPLKLEAARTRRFQTQWDSSDSSDCA